MTINKLLVKVHDMDAGFLSKHGESSYRFSYLLDYDGPAVSLTMPTTQQVYEFDRFPPFFDGLLPEGWQLEALLRQAKVDRHDYMRHLALIGRDAVGAVSVQPIEDSDD